MAYQPTPAAARRLERAIDLASFTEVERLSFLAAALMLFMIDLLQLATGGTWVGAIGSTAGWFILYWRLRAIWLRGSVTGDRGLFSLGMRTKEQRAFTALMFRQALTGRNPMRERPDHDPFATWGQRVGPPSADVSEA